MLRRRHRPAERLVFRGRSALRTAERNTRVRDALAEKSKETQYLLVADEQIERGYPLGAVSILTLHDAVEGMLVLVAVVFNVLFGPMTTKATRSKRSGYA